MQIVIDIPKEMWDWLHTGFPDEDDGRNAINAILKGTPLPKGHGDLIDRSKVIVSLMAYTKGIKTIGQCVDDVPTIIEAEKQEEQDE